MKLAESVVYGLIGLAVSNGFSQNAPEESGHFKHAVISNSGETIHLSANDPRPLAQAVDALQEQYGWRVNYEDPQYISKLDLVEVTNPPQHRSSHSEVRAHYPAGGAFNLDFPGITSPHTPPDEKKTLQLIVDSYNRTNNPGRFELRRGSDDEFDVVGTAAHDAVGHISQQKAALDLPITVAAAKRNALKTVELICQQLTEGGHVKVRIGVFPMSLQNTPVTVGGSRLPARKLLARTLASTGRRFTWRLLFDPDSKGYVLSLMSVRQP